MHVGTKNDVDINNLFRKVAFDQLSSVMSLQELGKLNR